MPEQAGAGVRLSKRMSELGLCSRREADEWIARGLVQVRGQTAFIGMKVPENETAITVDSRASREQSARVTILLNKPIGYVSGQAEGGYKPAKVLISEATHWKGDRSGKRFSRSQIESLVPAGRLDIDSTGLLVLTQDGRIAREIIGEQSQVDKEYIVRVSNLDGSMPPRLSEQNLARLNFGLTLDGVPLRRARVAWLNESELRFELTEGKKRQIRRMCEMVGLKVTRLKRVRIGAVRLGNLPLGTWRYLGDDERFV